MLMASGAPGELAFEVATPPVCEPARSLRLLLKDVELPRNRAVTIRAFAKPPGREESLIGILSVMGDSASAAGHRKIPEARVTAVPAFRQSIEGGRLPVVLRPYAGKTPIKNLDWSARAVEWVCR